MADVITELPDVAKSIFIFCKKCDVDRFQKVLAHKTPVSASVQCEVCKAKSTFRLPAAKAATKAAAIKRLSGAAAKRKEASAAAKKSAHLTEFQTMAQAAEDKAQGYQMKNKFSTNQPIQHPKFGMGYVKTALADKIEVVFEDEIRMLVHNRS